MTVGERIRKIRQEKGLSQKELGKRLNVSQQMIGQYENSNETLKPITLQKIASALQISINDLLENNFEDSPVYRAYKKNNALDSDLFLDYKNHTLTQGINWEPIDIKMIQTFKTLNEAGQAKAIERVEELTEIPRYTKSNKPVPYINAAHADNYTDAPEELKQLEENIMDDENF